MSAPVFDRSELDKYLFVADDELKLISVFDDLKYDRADADVLSVGMRQHAIKRLTQVGFKQKSGTVLVHGLEDVQCVIPKFHALGASPFDITRYTAKRSQDYYILTPTQTACQFVEHYPTDEAVDRIIVLIAKHPINIYRIMDFFEDKPAHKNFADALGHLLYVQRQAVETDLIFRMRALG